MDQNYRGLSNLGATCYMNSLLQTLFMTPQFREAVYQWKYNDRVHPEPSKSILYQMQKLFAKLQKCFPGQINTKQLVKSFDWQDQQAHMQQDIQQFNRVLFQALQISLLGKKNKEYADRNHFVRDLYQGQMLHYTHCNQCQNQSQREEVFQDLLVAVKNIYQKVYNSSVQLGLQRYMKPEVLDENNLYFCQGCNKKVKAERGVRFLKLPKLLNVILRRFDFDYYTFQRIKVHDRVEFPYVLNFNKYMQGYQNIPDKLNEDSSAYFKTENIPKKNFPTSTTTNSKRVTKKPIVTNIVGKKTTKPSTNTKSFLNEMRKRKMNSQGQNDDLLFISGSTPPTINDLGKKTESTTQKNIEKKDLAQQQNHPKSAQYQFIDDKQSPLVLKQKPGTAKTNASTVNLQARKQEEQSNANTQSNFKSVQSFDNANLPLPPIFQLQPPPQLSEPYSRAPHNSDSNDRPMSMQEELDIKMQQKQRLNKEKDKKLQQLSIKNQELIAQYLKEGPLVYELYSVMVHNGSATHGHYFSYIKSFQNQRWYCFNDQRVYDVNVEQIQASFGGTGSSSAYALYYRQVQSQNYQIQRRVAIPQYINTVVEQQIQSCKRRQNQKIENLQNIVILKIHYQLYVQQLEIMKNSTLQLCLEKARQMFNISQEVLPLRNCRLRMYNAVSDTKLQTFTGREKQSLEQLRIGSYKTLLVETKKQDEVFEQFIIGKISIRIVLWEINGSNLQSLDESHLKCFKVSVTKNSRMTEVQQQILKRRKDILKQEGKDISSENICIVKRHQNDQYSYHEVINMLDYKQKTLDELMVIDNQILFVEPDSDNLMWPQQFENQIYRINIRYNNPGSTKTQSILTDSRKTLGQLKEIICNLIGESSDDIIMRSGSNKSGMQLKILTMTMKDAKFITGKMLHFQKGIPAKQGQIRVQLYIATDAPIQLYNRLHQFQFVADVPINKQWKAGDVKQIFMKIVKKYKGIELQKGKFRIRQKVADKVGKIYRERPMKEQQLIQKREIAIEYQPDQIDIKQFAVYIRVWDPQQWSLSQKYEIIVNKATSMLDLGDQLSSFNIAIPTENLQICRILSIHKFNILDLCEMEYFPLTDTSVLTQPLFVNTDGLLFIVKNQQKQPRQLTKQEQTKFGGKIKQLTINNKKRMNSNYVAKVQKGVSIRVTQNKEEEIDEHRNNENKQ